MTNDHFVETIIRMANEAGLRGVFLFLAADNTTRVGGVGVDREATPKWLRAMADHLDTQDPSNAVPVIADLH